MDHNLIDTGGLATCTGFNIGYGLTQFFLASAWRVVGATGFKTVDSLLDNKIECRQVGVADGEKNNVLSGFLTCACLFVHAPERGVIHGQTIAGTTEFHCRFAPGFITVFFNESLPDTDNFDAPNGVAVVTISIGLLRNNRY